MQANQRVPALRGGQSDDLAAKGGWLRSNSVARRADETEDQAQRTGNPGNVGLSASVHKFVCLSCQRFEAEPRRESM